MESTKNALVSIYDFITDLLFPEHCLGCRVRGEIICIRCESNLRRAERETEHTIHASFDYRDPVIKKAIWNLKYYRRKSLGAKLGTLLYESMLEELSELESYKGAAPISLIPVPVSHSRMRHRGYNQAEVIAYNFANACGANFVRVRNDIVKKSLDTEAQARITNRAERLKNIRGAFEVRNPDFVRGGTFIVVDDVTTTGGTMREIIKVLKKAGAKHVVGFAIAH